MRKLVNKKSTLQNINFNNSEVDIFEVFEVLFKYKFIILAFSIFASLLGLIAFNSTPKYFELTSTISPAKETVFSNYFRLNKNIELSQRTYLDENIIQTSSDNMLQLTSSNIFKYFLSEFNDFEEVKKVLGEQKILNEVDLDEINDNEKLKLINNFSKNFQILKPLNDFDNYTISILWHDSDQGLKIFEKIMTLVLNNTKNSVVNDIYQIAEYLDFTKKNNIKILEKEILSILNLQKTLDEQRILHLIEQAEIARAINLKNAYLLDNNEITIKDIDLQSKYFGSSGTGTSNDDYLRGYIALDKERDLLLKRTQNELLLSNDQYAKLKNEINLIENDDFADQIKKDIEIILSDSPFDWVYYDLGMTNVKSLNKSFLIYISMPFFIGFILSALFSLFYSIFKKNRLSKI